MVHSLILHLKYSSTEKFCNIFRTSFWIICKQKLTKLPDNSNNHLQVVIQCENNITTTKLSLLSTEILTQKTLHLQYKIKVYFQVTNLGCVTQSRWQTHFWSMYLFYTLWKHLKSFVFRTYKIGALAKNGLINRKIILEHKIQHYGPSHLRLPAIHAQIFLRS